MARCSGHLVSRCVRATTITRVLTIVSRQARASRTRRESANCAQLRYVPLPKMGLLQENSFSWMVILNAPRRFWKESLSELNESRTIAYNGRSDSFHCALLERTWMETIVKVMNFLVTTQHRIVRFETENRCTLSAAKFRSIAARIWIFSPNIVRRLRKSRSNGAYFPLLAIFIDIFHAHRIRV